MYSLRESQQVIVAYSVRLRDLEALLQTRVEWVVSSFVHIVKQLSVSVS